MSTTKKKVLLAIEVVLIIICLAANVYLFVNDNIIHNNATAIEEMAPAPDGQMPAPDGQAPAPNGQAPAPNGQMPAPNGQAPAPDGQAPAPNGQAPAPNDQAPAPDGQAPAPSMFGNMIQNMNPVSMTINHILPLIMYILVLVYVFIDYKKPHGNILRYTMFIFAAYLALTQASGGSGFRCAYILPCAAIIAAYISGRLNKIEKNKYLIVITALLLFGFAVTEVCLALDNALPIIITSGSPFIIWLMLSNAYIARYKEHHEAGLMDAPAE